MDRDRELCTKAASRGLRVIRGLAPFRETQSPADAQNSGGWEYAELENTLLWSPARCSILMPVRRVTATPSCAKTQPF